MCKRSERRIRYRVDPFRVREHACSQAFALINRSVCFYPLTHQPLPFGVDRLVMLPLNGRLSVADAQIILVPAERFERHLSRQTDVVFDIEVDRTWLVMT